MLNYFQKVKCRVRVSHWWGPHHVISHLESTLLSSMNDILPKYVDCFLLKLFKLKLNFQSDVSEEYTGNISRIGVSRLFKDVPFCFCVLPLFLPHNSFYFLILSLHQKNRLFHDKKSLLVDCLFNCCLFHISSIQALDVTYSSLQSSKQLELHCINSFNKHSLTHPLCASPWAQSDVLWSFNSMLPCSRGPCNTSGLVS